MEGADKHTMTTHRLAGAGVPRTLIKPIGHHNGNSVVCHARAPPRGTVGTDRSTSDGTCEDAAARCSKMMSACASADGDASHGCAGPTLSRPPIARPRSPKLALPPPRPPHRSWAPGAFIAAQKRHYTVNAPAPCPSVCRVLGVSSAATLSDGPLCQFSRHFTSCLLISAPWAVGGQSRAWPRWAISPSCPPSAVACGWAPHHRPSAQPSCPS